jgi:RimJ/RimL family protein N-acetyltransferase
MGWYVAPGRRGRGVATAAARLLTAHAFDALGLERVFADIAETNAPSIGVAEANGYRYVGDVDVEGEQLRRYARARVGSPAP